MSSTRRVVSWITLVVAVYVIATPFALSLFSRTRDAQTLSEFYRPYMTDEGIAQLRSDLAVVNDAGAEVYDTLLPELRRRLGLTKAELDGLIRDGYPSVAALLDRAPTVLEYLNPGLEAVFAQQESFHDADDFPVANVPVDLGPWALLALGFALAGLGLWLRFGESVVPIVAVLVIGIGLLIGPAVLGWFHQTDAAEQAASAARAPFTPALARTTVDDAHGFDAAITEIREAMFPALGRRLGLSPAEMDELLHDEFPATMRFVDGWPDGLEARTVRLASSQVRFMDEFHNADATPYSALPWIYMVPGAVLVGAAGFGLFRTRRTYVR